MIKNNLIKNNVDNFLNSFKKINLKIFLILILDIAFYSIFIQVGTFFINQVRQRADNVDLSQNLLGISQEAANQLLSSLKGFFFFVIFSIIAFLILMIISWSIIKGIIWTITANKKFNLNFFKKFFYLNLIWIPIWFLLIFLFAVITKPETTPIFILITLIVAFYFTNMLYPLFLKNNRLNMIKTAFNLGIKKIHHLIIPYLIIIILFFIFSSVYRIATFNVSVNPNIFYGILLIFVAWLRYYFVEIVDSLIS